MTATWATEEGPTTAETEEGRYQLLWASVIRKAVMDWLWAQSKATVRHRRLFREVDVWLFGSGPRAFNSFPSLCAALGLQPQDIREKVRSMSPKDLREWL